MMEWLEEKVKNFKLFEISRVEYCGGDPIVTAKTYDSDSWNNVTAMYGNKNPQIRIKYTAHEQEIRSFLMEIHEQFMATKKEISSRYMDMDDSDGGYQDYRY